MIEPVMDKQVMDENTEIWLRYYEKALNRPHSPRTASAIKWNKSALKVAVDCGCGTGGDTAFLESHGYRVYGFDINSDSIAICRDRFSDNTLITLSQSSFEDYDYPSTGVVIANSSLFFAEPESFHNTWRRIERSLQINGVFAGDFMGIDDDWASGYRISTTSLTKTQVMTLFNNFNIISFNERNEQGKTLLDDTKHWHIFSVVAVKCV